MKGTVILRFSKLECRADLVKNKLVITPLDKKASLSTEKLCHSSDSILKFNSIKSLLELIISLLHSPHFAQQGPWMS